LEYIGIVGIILIVLAAYNRYRNGYFSKDNKTKEENQQDEEKSLNRFQKWWKQSYIREIYVVRAGQRKLLCFIPWVGVFLSVITMYWYALWIYESITDPVKPLEQLTKYEGIVIGYEISKKGEDILEVRLNNGTVKRFNRQLSSKMGDEWMDRKISIWTSNTRGITTLGSNESFQWMVLDGKDVNETKYKEHKSKIQYKHDNSVQNFFISFFILLSFLAVIWLINLKPIQQKTNEN